MSRLESGYRTLLRLLPKWYRQGHEEGMVATFLADADDVVLGSSWPGWAELWRILVLAVRLRVGGTGAPARPMSWGEAVRLVALLGLLARSILLPLGVLGVVWAWASGVGIPHAPINLGSLRSLVTQALTMLAFLAVVLGHRRLAVASGLLAAAVNIPAVWQEESWMALADSGLPVWVPFLCLVLGFRRDWVPVAHPGRWLVAMPVVAVLAMVVQLLAGPALFDLGSLHCLAVAAGSLFQLRNRSRPAWPLALSMLSVLVLVTRLVTLEQLAGLPTTARISGHAQIPVLIATTVAMAVVAHRALHRLPHPAAEHTSP